MQPPFERALLGMCSLQARCTLNKKSASLLHNGGRKLGLNAVILPLFPVVFPTISSPLNRLPHRVRSLRRFARSRLLLPRPPEQMPRGPIYLRLRISYLGRPPGVSRALADRRRRTVRTDPVLLSPVELSSRFGWPVFLFPLLASVCALPLVQVASCRRSPLHQLRALFPRLGPLP